MRKDFLTLADMVLDWADEKGITESGTPLAQIEKTREEVEETRDALICINQYAKLTDKFLIEEIEEQLEELQEQLEDGIGDVMVTLIILAHLCNTDALSCLERAFNEIKDRKGQMIDGAFVKEGGADE